jgi:indole-3-glycerol phosphate synthase
LVDGAGGGSRGAGDVIMGTRERPGGLLDAIAASVRTTLCSRRAAIPLEDLARAAEARQPGGSRFRDAISREGRVNIIAECKRRSPARGILAREYVPGEIARRYEQGGAAAVSVLTEPTFFDGALAHLEAARAATSLPLLRKDFILDEYQLHEARAAGADAVLLIVAMLDEGTLRLLARRAEDLGLAAIIEVHSSLELSIAADAGADIIGVNNRDLRDLSVDPLVCERLAEKAPRGSVMVAESGIRSRDDVERLAAAGYHAFLVGECLMTAADPAASLAGLIGRPDANARPADGAEA